MKLKKTFDNQETEIVPATLCDEETREIYLSGEVTMDMYQNAAAALRHLDKSKGTINLVINTNGGHSKAGFALADIIRSCKNKVFAYCFGECMSIGVAILAACDGRFAGNDCLFMVHDAKITQSNTLDVLALKRLVQELEALNNTYHRCVFNGSDLTLKEVESMCKKETYFTAEMALAFGIIDEIIANRKKRVKK